MSKLQAIIFDVDGTLADTERLGHRVAFNLAFADKGLDWHWDEGLYAKLLAVTGGKERIQFYLKEYLTEFPTENLEKFVVELHAKKTEFYVDLVRQGNLPLRDGARELIESARENNIRIAIATTTTPANVAALLESQLGVKSMGWFEVIAAGDVVKNKKPAPDIFLYALDKMGLDAKNCVALEDSRNGLLSATGAGLKTIVTSNGYTENEDFKEACLVVDSVGSADKSFMVKSGESFGQTSVNLSLLEQVLG